MIPTCLKPNIPKTAGECYLATIVIVCFEAVQSAILATACLLLVVVVTYSYLIIIINAEL